MTCFAACVPPSKRRSTPFEFVGIYAPNPAGLHVPLQLEGRRVNFHTRTHTMNQSDNIEKIAEALVEIQKEILYVQHTKENTHLKSTYANLEAIANEVQPRLNAVGIAWSQWICSAVDVGGRAFIGIGTKLLHKSGQWMSSVGQWPIPDMKGLNPAQCVMVVIKYGRRAGLVAAVGITTGEEDYDGQGAFPREPQGASRDSIAPMTTRTWQELFETKEWRNFPAPNSPTDSLSDLSWGEKAMLIKENQLHGKSPEVTAMNAAALENAANIRKLTLTEALDLVKWPGPAFLSMTSADIFAAFNIVADLPKPQAKA